MTISRQFRVITLVFVFLCLSLFSLSKVKANGQDLNIQCSISTCSVTQGDVPFFQESNMVPGKVFTRRLIVKNTSTQSGTFALEATNLRESEVEQLLNLADKITIVIRRSTPLGPVVYGSTPKTLKDVLTDGFLPLGNFTPNQQDTFFVTAAFQEDADNQFQSLETLFDLDLGFEFLPPSVVPSTPSDGSSGGGGGGGQASPTVCTQNPPVSAPVLTFSESSTVDGQVTLSWTSVATANNYAMNFGTQPGVYLYGNTSIGNQTSYTVTGLTPGIRYFFQVIPLNDCAPGPRSNEISTTGSLLSLAASVTPPSGFAQDQVLGVETEASSSALLAQSDQGKVLGEECVVFVQYLPIIFLVVQVVITLMIYFLFKNPENKVKQVGVLTTVVLTTLLYYYLRKCDCADVSWLSFLCKWYFVFAIIGALLTQFANYALIEREELK